MYKIEIYTDGACSGNPGMGGWAAILIYGNNIKEISGFEKETTNNKMELRAVIEALQALKYESNVTLYSDSAYVINAFTQGWLDNWQAYGWRTSAKKPVQNKELWLRLLQLIKVHKVQFRKVQGHSNNTYNNRCDSLARAQIQKHGGSQ